MRVNDFTATAGSKKLATEINALKTQLKRVAEVLAAEASTDVDRALDPVESNGKEAVADVIGAARAFVDNYAEAAVDAAARMSRGSAKVRDNAADSLIETVRGRPFGTIAAMLGIG